MSVRHHFKRRTENGERRTRRARATLICAAFALFALATPARAQYSGVPASGMMTKGDMPAGITPAQLQKVDFEQKLDAEVPLDLPFRDETGQSVMLARYFDGRPVILTLVYYECPMLCTEVLNGLVRSLKVLALEPGRDFTIVTVSFNPAEKAAEAAAKKKSYLQRYRRSGAEQGWHFLTGEPASITPLTEAVGFHYYYDERLNQYAHPTGIMILTPEGRVSKYLYGIDYAPKDVKLALVDASGSKIGSPVDKLLLYCYHYDPTTGKYGLAVLTLIRLGGIVTVAALGAFILAAWRRDRKRALKPVGQHAGR
jgi:protein SCO1/2